MKKFILFLFLFGIGLINCLGQELIIEDSIVLKSGIYKSFEEFKYNNPSIPLRFKLKINEDKNNSYCTLKLKKDEIKNLVNIYGLCDGETIFINTFGKKLSSSKIYSEIKYLGRYCYFDEYELKFIRDYREGYKRAKLINTPKIIDIVNGRSIMLTTNVLEDILILDSEIYQKFRNQWKRYLYLKDYLIEYSEKHQSEAYIFNK